MHLRFWRLFFDFPYLTEIIRSCPINLNTIALVQCWLTAIISSSNDIFFLFLIPKILSVLV